MVVSDMSPVTVRDDLMARFVISLNWHFFLYIHYFVLFFTFLNRCCHNFDGFVFVNHLFNYLFNFFYDFNWDFLHDFNWYFFNLVLVHYFLYFFDVHCWIGREQGSSVWSFKHL